jgi:hypothetical protein
MFAYCRNDPVVSKDICGHIPTDILDTDGDGEDDCFLYEYTYNIFDSPGFELFALKLFSKTGRIYIYKNVSSSSSENINLPLGFIEGTDFIICDFTGDIDPNIQVRNSYKCTSRAQMEAIIDVLLEYGSEYAPSWKRTKDSLIREWIEHNRYALFSERARHVDFDNDEEGKGMLYFLKKAIDGVLGWTK